MPSSRAAMADRDRRVLAAMAPGMTYEAGEVAAALETSRGVVRKVLQRLARDGQVTRVEPAQCGMAVG